jgi:ABC-type uncharacterized transport system ATPase subunit
MDGIALENVTKSYDTVTAVNAISLKVRAGPKGMQQKVQFITAVIHRPPVVILDEPFSGLDPVNAATIQEIMLSMRDQGSTIVPLDVRRHRRRLLERAGRAAFAMAGDGAAGFLHDHL